HRPTLDRAAGTSRGPIAGNVHSAPSSPARPHAQPPPAGLGDALRVPRCGSPSGTPVSYRMADGTDDARLGYPVGAGPDRPPLPRQPPGVAGTAAGSRGTRCTVGDTAPCAPLLSLCAD